MQDHYAIIELDDNNRVLSVLTRIGDRFFTFEVHDNHTGARKLFLHVRTATTASTKQAGPARDQALKEAAAQVKRMYGR